MNGSSNGSFACTKRVISSNDGGYTFRGINSYAVAVANDDSFRNATGIATNALVLGDSNSGTVLNADTLAIGGNTLLTNGNRLAGSGVAISTNNALYYNAHSRSSRGNTNATNILGIGNYGIIISNALRVRVDTSADAILTNTNAIAVGSILYLGNSIDKLRVNSRIRVVSTGSVIFNSKFAFRSCIANGGNAIA